MAANKRKLADSQISSLIESLPGIASVLRSPVADAMVAMIRAAVGLEKFSEDHAIELMHFAVRRGLIETDEADEVMADVRAATKMKKARAPKAKAPAKAPKLAKTKAAKPAPKAAKKKARR